VKRGNVPTGVAAANPLFSLWRALWRPILYSSNIMIINYYYLSVTEKFGFKVHVLKYLKHLMRFFFCRVYIYIFYNIENVAVWNTFPYKIVYFLHWLVTNPERWVSCKKKPHYNGMKNKLKIVESCDFFILSVEFISETVKDRGNMSI
jgi:hypothetical protein